MAVDSNAAQRAGLAERPDGRVLAAVMMAASGRIADDELARATAIDPADTYAWHLVSETRKAVASSVG